MNQKNKTKKQANGKKGGYFRTSTPESVYAKKMSTRHPKDMLDIEALEDKIDHTKIEEMSKYHTTLKIVKPEEIIQENYSLLDSGIEATEESTRTGVIYGQAETIKSLENAKTQEQETQKSVEKQ